MKVLILLSFVVCLVEVGFCQTDFRKGYIITNTRDTIVGLVDYREGVKAHEFCVFKKSKDQNTSVYQPQDLIGYGIVDDKFFESKDIPIAEGGAKRAFLEVIVNGLVILYKYGEMYFMEKDSNGLIPLTNESKKVLVEETMMLRNTHHHVSTINMLMVDCNELNSSSPDIRLTERSLAHLVEEYNQCHGITAITYKAKKAWAKYVFGVTGGINFSQIKFENKVSKYQYLSGSFERSTSPVMGLSLDISSPRLNERISFHSDVLYVASNYYNYNQSEALLFAERNYAAIKVQQLKVPVAFRYTYPKRNFTPYLNVGVSTTFQLSSETKWVKETAAKLIQPGESTLTVNTTDGEIVEVKAIQMGLWTSTGILKSINTKLNAFMELRFEYTDGISKMGVDQQITTKSNITNIQILIGLRTK